MQVLGSNPEGDLEGYVDADADFAGDLDQKISITGFVVFVYGNAGAWFSKKQKSVATSTVEAKFMASSRAIKEDSWLK